MKIGLNFAFKLTRKVKLLGLGASAAAGAIIILVGLVNHVYFVAEFGELKIVTDLITQILRPPDVPPYYKRSILVDYFFHTYVALAILIGAAVPVLFLNMESRRKKMIDQSLPRLLEDLAEGQQAGMTLLQALQESSKRDYGPISEELKRLVAQLTWGFTFEESFKSFARRIGTDMTSRVTVLLLEAVRLGGDLKTTFRSTAAFVSKMIDLRNDREAQLRAYLSVIYISTMVFLLVLVILYQSLFVQMAEAKTSFLRLTLSLEAYKGYLFDLAVFEAMMGGFAAGKLSEGVTLYGLKHSLMMLVVVLVVFTFFF